MRTIRKQWTCGLRVKWHNHTTYYVVWVFNCAIWLRCQLLSLSSEEDEWLRDTGGIILTREKQSSQRRKCLVPLRPDYERWVLRMSQARHISHGSIIYKPINMFVCNWHVDSKWTVTCDCVLALAAQHPVRELHERCWHLPDGSRISRV